MNNTAERIEKTRCYWGKRVLILAHHYQADQIIRHADAVGDSLELAHRAAAERDAERIVFCGVRFMAETADILTSAGQDVYMPDSDALCPMAAMADTTMVRTAWRTVRRISDDPDAWLPIVYVNSTASIKAFCGSNGGWTCTSGNAVDAFQQALKDNRRILFLPDEHLGVNTARELGISGQQIAVYNPLMDNGGLSAQRLAAARIVVWAGYCHVHTAFMTAQIAGVRRRYKDVHVIVHPECPSAVAQAADENGSTSRIIQAVEKSPPGSVIAIGTESRLVRRLARQYEGRLTVIPLFDSICPNMSRNTGDKLACLLEQWPATQRIRVPASLREPARLALQRMLALGS